MLTGTFLQALENASFDDCLAKIGELESSWKRSVLA
jgi:hypothetical protein